MIDHISPSFCRDYTACHLKGLYHHERRPEGGDRRYAGCGRFVHAWIAKGYDDSLPEADPSGLDADMVDRAKAAIEGYRLTCKRIPRLQGHASPEVRIDWRLTDEPGDPPMMGFIDLLQEEGGRIWIEDWKTGSPNEDDRQQMRMYAAAVADTYGIPIVRIAATLHYLRHRRSETVRCPSVEAVRADIVRRTIMPLRAGDWEPNVGPQCSGCTYRQICGAWAETSAGTPVPTKS